MNDVTDIHHLFDTLTVKYLKTSGRAHDPRELSALHSHIVGLDCKVSEDNTEGK